MRGRQDIWEQQTQALHELRQRALELAREPDNGIDDETKSALRHLALWLEDRAARFDTLARSSAKVSITRLRLLTLQLEKLLEQLARGQRAEQAYQKLHELLDNQQRRDLYDDMIGCLRELSTLCIERGQGRQGALYHDMAQRLELRLESGHLELHNEQQRAKDVALYAEFREKLESMKA